MYSLVRNLQSPTLALQEVTTCLVSLILAEVFYKFHSFSLECLAFLATWGVLSGLVDFGTRLWARANPSEES
ncbi:MAG TPA: hypothetical protein VGY66_25460 [Gemmataceae bacterium]|jgi:hypothetical protein|nr:hypothetical protein [Gemmataceae bacterium]